MSYTASEIARHAGGEVVGDGSTALTGFAQAASAAEGDLTFADTQEFLAMAEASAAAAILVPRDFGSSKKVLIRVAKPRVAVAKVLPLFFADTPSVAAVDPSARIAASAQVDASAHIGPGCIVGDEVTIGARCVLMGGNHVGNGTTLGDDVRLFPNVVLYPRTVVGNRVRIHAGTVIGSDGYGYVFDEGHHRKVLQVGNVVIHEDVEIGANCAIDRGALDATIIGKGAKIDNLVHIAHNVVIGSHCLIMGQCGFAGSTELGDYAVIASQSGVAGHLKIGRQSVIGAKTGVMRDVPDGGRVLGIPAAPETKAKRQWVAVQQLPEMIVRLRELEKEVERLKGSLGGPGASS